MATFMSKTQAMSSATASPTRRALLATSARPMGLRRGAAMRVRAEQEPGRPQGPGGPVPTKLSEDQLRQVAATREGELSPEMAELRANLGSAWTDANQLQAFDGPAPETINGRLAMLGVLVGLIGEATTGMGLLEQTAHHPITVFLSFVLISIATYVPLTKGFTRKEPWANRFLGLQWTPKAENWNGRLAMMGFAGMVLTEALAGCNSLQALGLQAINVLPH